MKRDARWSYLCQTTQISFLLLVSPLVNPPSGFREFAAFKNKVFKKAMDEGARTLTPSSLSPSAFVMDDNSIVRSRSDVYVSARMRVPLLVFDRPIRA